jgi:hypothetical protein
MDYIDFRKNKKAPLPVTSRERVKGGSGQAPAMAESLLTAAFFAL